MSHLLRQTSGFIRASGRFRALISGAEHLYGRYSAEMLCRVILVYTKNISEPTNNLPRSNYFFFGFWGSGISSSIFIIFLA